MFVTVSHLSKIRLARDTYDFLMTLPQHAPATKQLKLVRLIVTYRHAKVALVVSFMIKSNLFKCDSKLYDY